MKKPFGKLDYAKKLNLTRPPHTCGTRRPTAISFQKETAELTEL